MYKNFLGGGYSKYWYFYGVTDKNAYFDIFFAYSNQNLAPEIVCGVIFWGSFLQQAFFWVRLKILLFFGVKFIFCDEPRYRKFW